MTFSSWPRRLAPYWLPISLIVGLVVLRFALLAVSPPGFYVDEAATGAHVAAMLHAGTDAHGHAWPLFTASLGGGYTTPIYLYPLVGWAALFGTGEYALRAFSMLLSIITCLVIGAAVRQWLGSAKAGLMAIIAGLLLPWGWLQGSLAWDPAMVPLCVALSLWALASLLYSPETKARLAGAVVLPLSLIALAYVYPPCRVTAPLLMIGAYLLLIVRKKVSWRQIIITSAVSLIAVIPLAVFMVQPDALARSRELSVFHAGIIAGAVQFIGNLLALINPVFLFVTGDSNLRHATGIQGMLGLAALLPLLAVLWFGIRHWRQIGEGLNRPRPVGLLGSVAIVGIVASLLGSALTSEGQPHSLRACAAWPFYVLLITIGWQLLHRHYRKLQTVALSLACLSLVAYAIDLGVFYPSRAANSFDTAARQAIANRQAVDYPALALQYYHWR
jgi:4-amino-4-deoxy-L-arabinose transferase-like glycosyltransferase